MSDQTFQPDLQPPGDDRVAAVLAQLERDQAKTDSPRRSVWLLLLSLIAFILLGAWFWSFELVLYLVPILVFHELGHYVAMRYFRYRNVKMFFVPLFGAAVSGEHFNVPGWKKVIVSLAGPLPGILLAIPMAVAALAWESQILSYATVMLALLNAFNLLPLLPLDGGWVAHALYFSRQPWLEAVFRVAAAVFMIVVGIIGQLYLITAFGALMLLAAPTALRNSKIAKRLQQDGLPMVSADHQTIPREVVTQIVAQLPSEGPLSETKVLANQTRQIFDVLNTRPPGVTATIGLTLLYLMGWVVTCLVLAGLFLWPRLNQTTNQSPSVSVAPESVQLFRESEQPLDDYADRYFVLGTYDNSQALAAEVSRLKKVTDCKFAFATAGDSIVLSIDQSIATQAASVQLLEEFKQQSSSHTWFESDDVFQFTVTCQASDAASAEQLALRINDMPMFGNDLALAEPWSPLHAISDAQYFARQTRRFLDQPFDVAADEELNRLSDAAIKGEKPVDAESIQRRFREYDEAYERKYQQAVEQLRDDTTGQFDQVIVEHWIERPGGPIAASATNMDEKAWRLKLADLLGRIPNATPVANDEWEEAESLNMERRQVFRYSVNSVKPIADGTHLELSFLHFRNPITGLPSLLQWLESEGCQELDFQIFDGNAWDN